MNKEQQHKDLASQAADGSIGAEDDLSYVQDQHFTDNLKRLSALKSAFSDANRLESGNSDSQLPARWGHLRIIKEIGQGAFGTVYRAFDSVLHREVALKLRRIEHQKASTNSYIIEARRLARVYHPNVLAVHGADIHDNRIGLWSDLIDGQTLQVKLEQSETLSTVAIIDIAEQLLHALEAIHHQGLVHGDIKAENVMLSQSRVILMDFGAAQRMGRMSTFGSLASMAPEQLMGQAVSAATDVYSLGALLYRLCVNQSVSLNKIHSEQLELSVDKRLLKKKRGKVISNLVLSMLSLDSSSRPGTASILQTLTDLKRWPVKRLKLAAITTIFFSLSIALLISLLATHRAEDNYKSSEIVKNLVILSMDELNPKYNFGPASVSKMYQTMITTARVELTDYPQVRADIFVTVGQNMFDIGEHDNGLQLVKEGLELMLKTGREPAKKLRRMYALISAFYRKMSEYEKATIALDNSLYYHSLIEYKDQIEAQKEAIRLYTIKANLTGRLGDWHGRLQLNKEILKLRENLVGSDDPWLAIDYYHIGQSLYLLNRYTEAFAAFKQAEEFLAKEGDHQSTRFLSVKTGIMTTYIKLGKLNQARQLLQFLRQQYPLLVAENHLVYATLDIAEASIIASEGDGVTSSNRLQQLLDKKSLPPHQTYKTKLKLIKVAIVMQQWALASDYLAQLNKQPQAYYRPIIPYLAGTSAYVNYHMGKIDKPPIEQLNDSMSVMRQQGYSALSEYEDLETWKNILLKSLEIENI